ncbi:hypothetical protein PF010_g10283 [Phytophthora fragariae]|uniref:Uncharacterized protein n=1 Tax=Phytophthora fragariae TaxID=53985 RepID=A0A6G0LA04_9STRA|nr:hypothetical protein PF010_g10283 [Phytophthora fragariae]
MLEMLLSSEPSRVLLQSMSDPSAGDYSKVTLKTGEVHNREIEHDGVRVDEDFVMILGRDGATIKSKKIRTMDKLQAVSGYKNRSKAGDNRTRAELNSGVYLQQRFWEDVHRAFVSASET